MLISNFTTDHVDYSIIQSTNPDFNKAIVRVNVHRQHRQTIQYIQPQDAYALGQAELLVIDEAAAIPLPLVRKLMGPYLIFMASTINGYEGTGRSLSLKLIQQLRDQSKGLAKIDGNNDIKLADRSGDKASKNSEPVYAQGRTLREITLSEPIRYAQDDSVERSVVSGAFSSSSSCQPSSCLVIRVKTRLNSRDIFYDLCIASR